MFSRMLRPCEAESQKVRLRLQHHQPQNQPGNHLGQPKDQRYPWQLLNPGISCFINVCEATYRLHSAYWIIHHPRSGESETMTRMCLFLLSLECVRKTVCLSIGQFLLWFVITPPKNRSPPLLIPIRREPRLPGSCSKRTSPERAMVHRLHQRLVGRCDRAAGPWDTERDERF